MSWFYRKIIGVHNFFVKEPKKKGVLLPWHDACVEHDKIYHVGGSSLQRFDADLTLMWRVVEKGYPTVGILMFLGVRLGGYGLRAEVGYRLVKVVNWRAIRYNWGYGWGPSYRYEEDDDDSPG